MNQLEPLNQTKLFGLEHHLLEFVRLFENNIYPNKLLISGLKGTGKCTLAYHFINYVLSKNEKNKYDLKNFRINSDNSTFKTILNKSNINLFNIDITSDKKTIDINQIRNLINSLNKSSFNNKPRFVLIDNIELLNVNSINALLKILEEPNDNINFILINNNKKILPTLISRCINYKMHLSNKECVNIANHLFDGQLNKFINKDFINYYFTPGNIYHLIKFADQYNYDISNTNLKSFLQIVIKDNLFKKDPFMKYMIFNLIEFYFRKISLLYSKKIYEKYSYFLKRIANTENFNLDEDTLFLEFKEEILDG